MSWELVRVPSELRGKIAMSLGGFVGKLGSAVASPSQISCPLSRAPCPV
ncbi:hypothetical protein [Fervidibacter sacchari]